MKIFHSNDIDGACAASIILNYYNSLYGKQLANPYRVIACDITLSFPYHLITNDEPTYMIGFNECQSIPIHISSFNKNVIWIGDVDIDTIHPDSANTISGLRYNGISSCLLVWCYLYKMNLGKTDFELSMIKSAPFFIKLINDRYQWIFEHRDDSLYLCEFISSINNDPKSVCWSELMHDDCVVNHPILTSFIDSGKKRLQYKRNDAKQYLDSNAYECSFKDYDYKCLAVDITGFSVIRARELFEITNLNTYDILILYHKDTKTDIYRYLLYSYKVDLRNILDSESTINHKCMISISDPSFLIEKREGAVVYPTKF